MSENKNTPESTGFDAEFLSKRLGRVCTRLGLTQPFGDNHESNAAVAGTTLAAVDLAIESLAKQRDELRLTETNLRQQIAHLNDEIAGHKSTIEFVAKRRDELQTKADAMAETINAIAGLCTYQHESKEDFIGRVRAVLGDDPDLRLSIVRKERDELLAALEPFATAFKPAAEQLRKYGASDVMLTYLDRNTVTPTMTMGDFRRAFEAVTGTKCHGQQEKQAETETTVPALVFFPAGSLGEEVEP